MRSMCSTATSTIVVTKGRATAQATSEFGRRLAKKNVELSFSASGAQRGTKGGWTVSPFGFGGYRVTHQNQEHQKAL